MTKINYILRDGLRVLLKNYRQALIKQQSLVYKEPMAQLDCNDLKIAIKQLEKIIQDLENI